MFYSMFIEEEVKGAAMAFMWGRPWLRFSESGWLVDSETD